MSSLSLGACKQTSGNHDGDFALNGEAAFSHVFLLVYQHVNQGYIVCIKVGVTETKGKGK